jgi:transposase
MSTRFSVAAHLSAEELAARYRAARDPVERSRWQMVWLLVSGRPLAEVAAVTGYSTRWVREVVRRYNDEGPGPDSLADRRHANAGGAPLLDAAGRAALTAALTEPPPEGGLWTAAKVAKWIGERTGREKVPAQRGWDWLRRTGHSLHVPRPRHERAASAEDRAAFQKD